MKSIQLSIFSIVIAMMLLATPSLVAQARESIAPTSFRYDVPVHLTGRMRTNATNQALLVNGDRSMGRACYLRLTTPISLAENQQFGMAEEGVTELRLVASEVPFEKIWSLAQRHAVVRIDGRMLHANGLDAHVKVFLRVSKIQRLTAGMISDELK